MKQFRFLVCVALLCMSGTTSWAWWQSIQQVSVGSAAYVGPGDVVAGANAWYGLRAYNSAQKGTKAIQVCNVADIACADLSTDAVTGALVITTIGGSSCSVVTCTIKTFYDQTGGTYCTTACDATQATIGNRATFIVSCLNSLPCARFGAAGGYSSPNNTGALSQPYTISAVASRTGAFTTAGQILSTNGANNVGLNFRQVASTVQMFAGTAGQVISNITDNNFHSFQAVFNGASSILYCGGSAGTSCSVGGVSNSISPGTNATSATVAITVGSQGAGTLLTGDLIETGLWPSGFSAGNQSAMAANQTAFWGAY